MSDSTFPFTCPHCAHQTEVALEYAGKEGPCVACGKPVQLPDAETARELRNKKPKDADYTTVLVTGLTLVAVVAILAGVFLGTSGYRGFLGATRLKAMTATCHSNLQLIGVALQSYHQRFQVFPPAYLADATGKPMHSWRVLILPDLGYQDLYDQYDFSQAWNSPQNMSLVALMPSEYACPADPTAASKFESNYYAVTGNQTAFPPGQSTTASELGETALLVEGPARGFSWLNPVDLDVARMTMRLNGSPLDPGSRHESVHVLMADNTIRELPADTRSDVLRDLFTRP